MVHHRSTTTSLPSRAPVCRPNVVVTSVPFHRVGAPQACLGRSPSQNPRCAIMTPWHIQRRSWAPMRQSSPALASKSADAEMSCGRQVLTLIVGPPIAAGRKARRCRHCAAARRCRIASRRCLPGDLEDTDRDQALLRRLCTLVPSIGSLRDGQFDVMLRGGRSKSGPTRIAARLTNAFDRLCRRTRTQTPIVNTAAQW